LTDTLLSITEFNQKDKWALFTVWFLFTSVSPFELYAIVPYHPYKIIPFVLILFFVGYLIYFRIELQIDGIVLIIVIQILYSAFGPIIHLISLNGFRIEDGQIYHKLILHLTVILFTYLFVKATAGFEKLAYTFVLVLLMMAVLGSFSIIIIAYYDLNPFSYTLIPDHRPISNFITMFTTGEYKSDGTLSIVRSAGYFDEPGTFAFYLIVALLLTKMYKLSRRLEFALIIFGFCTLSLAYFISIAVYFVFFELYAWRIKRIFVISILFISALFYIHTVGTAGLYDLEVRKKNQMIYAIYALTTYRLQTDNTKNGAIINGDNRSLNLRHSIEAFKSAPVFGLGMNAHSKDRDGYKGKLCCNPFHPLATEGLFGTIVYFALFSLWGISCFSGNKLDWISILCWIIIFVNLVQRPGFTAGPFGYFAYILLYKATAWRKNLILKKDVL